MCHNMVVRGSCRALLLLYQVVDFVDCCFYSKALEAIDEVGDILKIKYSRRKQATSE